MMNVGVNPTSAVLGASYGVYQQVEEAREALRMAAREVVRRSERLGINLTEREIEDYIDVLCKLSPGGNTSMLQDIYGQFLTAVAEGRKMDRSRSGASHANSESCALQPCRPSARWH